MPNAYQIKDWDTHFENNRTRELKHMEWIPVPNKMDGDGYTELVDHPNGAAHFGAWIAIVEVASKCDPRGTLLREGRKPHDAASLARVTRLPRAVFEEVLPRLLEIGWLVDNPLPVEAFTEAPQEGAAKSQEDAPSRARAENGTEGNGTEGNGTEVGSQREGRAAAPNNRGNRVKLCDEAYLTELEHDPAYAGIDVRRAYHKMIRWCKEKRKEPTRGRFLNWLNREDRPLAGDADSSKSALTGRAAVEAVRQEKREQTHG